MSAVRNPQEWHRRGPAIFPPRWASAWGDDRFGLWVDLVVGGVAGVVQRLRWIEPGSFMMGDETQLEKQLPTTIAAGIWLADSACTQALWQAVMGNNPSYFNETNRERPESPQHPVEQISWNDIAWPPKGFLARLRAFTEGVMPELPTEAQWSTPAAPAPAPPTASATRSRLNRQTAGAKTGSK